MHMSFETRHGQDEEWHRISISNAIGSRDAEQMSEDVPMAEPSGPADVAPCFFFFSNPFMCASGYFIHDHDARCTMPRPN
jgi:hypothetical protein